MFAPINWLKEYVDISLPTKELAWRLTELGLSVEKVLKMEGEDVFEVEVTPNRPDLLSIIGIAREIAAIGRKKIKLPSVSLPRPSKNLPITIHNDFKLFPRYTGIILDNISVKSSPDWLKKRIKQLNLRPINTIVDITNYVMFEMGIPTHAFDYDQIKGHEIHVSLSKGGEEFTSVDEKSYKLPKNAIIIKDRERIIDLCGIKGGLNSGITDKTSTVYLQVTADDPLLIRRSSHALALRSDASAIFERGVDKGGLLESLKRAAWLILTLAGGEVASDSIDLKEKEFNPWKLDLDLERVRKVLGIHIPEKEITSILESLALNPKEKRHPELVSGSSSKSEMKMLKQVQHDKNTSIITVTIPTYRQDLKIEEDLIEEVARIYGYNRFTPTFINSSIPTEPISYFKNYSFEEKVKNIISGFGYTEVYTYSLISKQQLNHLTIEPSQVIKLTNPVSLDYEYLRPTLKGNLLTALKLNISNFDSVTIFELGRVYRVNKPGMTAGFEEPYHLGLIRSDGNYEKIKGSIEELLHRLGIGNVKCIPASSNLNKAFIRTDDTEIGYIEIVSNSLSQTFELETSPAFVELDFSAIEKLEKPSSFTPVSPYPSIIEDIALVLKPGTYIGELIDEIKQISPRVARIELLDSYKDTRTLRIYYHDRKKTLNQKETQPLRDKILSLAESNYSAKLKV